MHVQVRRAGAVALLAIGGAVLSSACVANESSLFVRGCMVNPQDSCVVQASINGDFLFSGEIDGVYANPQEYDCFALVENQLVERGDMTKLRTETSRITLYSADVQVLNDNVNSPSALAAYTVPLSGFVDPGTGTDPGIGLTKIEMLDQATVVSLAKTAMTKGLQNVVVSVYVHGRTLGGQELTSAEFKFPVQVAGGQTCVPAQGDTCVNPAGKPTANCHPGIDSATDCRSLDPCKFLSGCVKDMTSPTGISGGGCPSAPGYGDGSCCP